MSNATSQRMLAHELTHVVQQRSGPVDGSPAPGGINISHPSDRFEQAAEHSADQVMSSPVAAPPVTAAAPAAPAVQREEEEKPEDVQTLAIQREEEEKPEDVQTMPVQREEDQEPEENA